jgi:predicted dehydrogenase
VVKLPHKVRVAMLGLDGHISEVLSPLPQLPDVEIVAYAEPDAATRQSALRNRRLAAARSYDDYRVMLDKEKPDVVSVCNPNGERAAAIEACLERRMHVVAEKPLAIELEDLAKVRRALDKSGSRLTMLLPMRYWSPFLALRRIVESGEIGEVAQIGAQKSYKAGARPAWMTRRASYGGTIPWIGIHMVDLMRWSSGREFTEVASFQARVGAPELGDMENTTGSLFRLDNGGVAALRMDYLRSETATTHGDDRLRLAGTRGIAEYQASTGVTLMTAGEKPRTLVALPKPRWLFVEFLESVYAGKAETLSLADIFRVNEIVLKAREAAERGQVVRL